MFFALMLSLAAEPDAWYAKAVKSVTAEMVPATAKPGQTVTFKVIIELNEGYHTYASSQPDKAAANMVNKFTFADPGAVVFVGEVIDPADPVIKAEPELGIKELFTYKGKAVFERKAVVNPAAKAGDVEIELPMLQLSVCDAESCFPPKKLKLTAKLKIAGDAVEVEKQWKADVEKALKGK